MKTLPKTEDGYGISCLTKTHGEYCISQNTSKTRGRFTLWKCSEDGYEKIASANAPQDLYPKIPWD